MKIQVMQEKMGESFGNGAELAIDDVCFIDV